MMSSDIARVAARVEQIEGPEITEIITPAMMLNLGKS